MNLGEFQALWDRQSNAFRAKREKAVSDAEFHEARMNVFLDDLIEIFAKLKMEKKYRRFSFVRKDCASRNVIEVKFRGLGWLAEDHTQLEIRWDGEEIFGLGEIRLDGSYNGLYSVYSFDQLLIRLVPLINEQIHRILK